MSRDKKDRSEKHDHQGESPPSAPKQPIVRRRSEDDPDDTVGYRRPPRAHQFKPGRSGNPKGRPKGRKNEATMLNELLFQKILVRERGRERRITLFEAMLRRFAEDSLKGNIKAASFLLNRFGAVSPTDSRQPDFSDDDEAVLKAYVQEVLSKEDNS
ncbi:DUF5681 domain-containing protein [Bradyrhizobium sp. 2TAF36]|uniref:DUF5681 domain-containing protein n=1 Tax=Bradyrhizobium sp. 2TAF36 TaxID=3233016 RepID=UPI003F92728F